MPFQWKSVKEWCKEHGLDFTTYYRWERKILTSIIPAEDIPGLSAPNLPAVTASTNTIIKVELAPNPEEQDSYDDIAQLWMIIGNE